MDIMLITQLGDDWMNKKICHSSFDVRAMELAVERDVNRMNERIGWERVQE